MKKYKRHDSLYFVYLFIAVVACMPKIGKSEDLKCGSGLPGMVNARSNHSSDLLTIICHPADEYFYKAYNSSGKIDYSKVKKINCNFQQVLLSRVTSSEKIDKEQKEIEDQLKSEKKDWNALCDGRLGMQMKLFDISSGIGAERMAGPLKEFKSACERKNSVDIKLALRNLELLETETCSVFAKSWTGEFSRISEGKWISQGAPTGTCSLVSVEVFECGSDNFWEYRTTRVDSDKGEYCKAYEETLNKPMISSPKFPRPLEMKCLYFK